MSVFDRNIGVLCERFPRFHREILDHHAPSDRLTVETTPTGEITATVEGVYLHSRRNPVREAQRAIEQLPSNAPLIIFGFGLGYHLQAALEMHHEQAVVLFEPDVPLFLEALKYRDSSALFTAENLTLLLDIPAERIASVLQPIQGEFGVVKVRSVQTFNESRYQHAEEEIRKLVSKRRINENTLKRFGRLWVRNLFHNLERFSTAAPLNTLAGKYAGIPALVLAAGPGLDAILPLVAQLHERMVIIAVDTALQALKRVGIDPDYLIVVDPQYWNTRHLDRCETEDIFLISESSTHPAVFRRGYRGVFFCSSLFPLGRYFENRLGEFGKLGAGGSVATTAWDFAARLDCSAVYMAGLDLGFPNRQTHCRGSFFEERCHLIGHRRQPAETFAFNALNDAAPFPEADNTGGSVLTDRRLIIYKWWFEGQLAADTAVETHNLSAGGVRIEGMPYSRKEMLLTLPPQRSLIDKINKTVEQNSRVDTSDKSVRKSELIRTLAGQLHEELHMLAELSRGGLKLAALLLNNPTPEIRRNVLPQLDLIDARILGTRSRELAGFLIQSEIHDVLAASSDDKTEENPLQKSITLYRAIADSAGFQLDLLTRNFPRDTGEKE